LIGLSLILIVATADHPIDPVSQFERTRATIVRQDVLEPRQDLLLAPQTPGQRLRVKIGDDILNHWEFEQRLASLRGSTPDAEMKARFSPADKRNDTVAGTTMIVGGAMAALSLIEIWIVSAIRSSVCSESAVENLPLEAIEARASKCAGLRDARTGGIVGTAVGGSTLLAGLIYTLTRTEPVDPDTSWFDEPDLRKRVEEYNRIVRGQLDEHSARNQPPARAPARTSRAQPWITVVPNHRGASVVWRF